MVEECDYLAGLLVFFQQIHISKVLKDRGDRPRLPARDAKTRKV